MGIYLSRFTLKKFNGDDFRILNHFGQIRLRLDKYADRETSTRWDGDWGLTGPKSTNLPTNAYGPIIVSCAWLLNRMPLKYFSNMCNPYACPKFMCSAATSKSQTVCNICTISDSPSSNVKPESSGIRMVIWVIEFQKVRCLNLIYTCAANSRHKKNKPTQFNLHGSSVLFRQIVPGVANIV